MSFSNFLHPLLPMQCYFETPLYPYPWLAYALDHAPPPLKVEEGPSTLEKVPSQTPGELDFELIEERLRKMHAESEHHRKTHWTAE